MKVSIAVPSYNYGNYLEICLNSILMQKYQDYEVLIADGGSTDESNDIISRFCVRDERFKLVSNKDKGQPDAIVKAFNCSTGDILCFLNADDHYICKDALSSVVKAFKAYPDVDVISCGGYYTDSKGCFIKPVRYRYHPLDSIALMRFRTAILQPATFWTRSVYNSINIRLDFHYSFDSVFFYEAYCMFVWLELQKPVAGYRLHKANKSVQIIPERIFELARFEELKFGANSIRPYYLRIIGLFVLIFIKLPFIGSFLCRSFYRFINTISYLTVYRLPSI